MKVLKDYMFYFVINKSTLASVQLASLKFCVSVLKVVMNFLYALIPIHFLCNQARENPFYSLPTAL